MSTGFYEASVAGTTEWYTPPWIFERLKLHFDLDVCAPPGGVPWVPADAFYDKTADGLVQPWHGRVWMNPPYGPGIDRWLAKFVGHKNGIALLPSRTDTNWFHRYTGRADLLCFLRGRIKFVDIAGKANPHGPRVGSLFLACGADSVTALYNFADIGCCIPGLTL